MHSQVQARNERQRVLIIFGKSDKNSQVGCHISQNPMSLLDSIDTKQVTLKSLKINELCSFHIIPARISDPIFDGNLQQVYSMSTCPA